MMIFKIFLIYFLFLSTSFAQEEIGQQTVIEGADLRRKCDFLMNKREEKIAYKNKLRILLKKNEKILDAAPTHKKVSRTKLMKQNIILKHKLDLAIDEIKRQNEEIIKRGCPPISLN